VHCTRQHVNCWHTLQTAHAASPGGQILTFKAVLELSQWQCGWSIDPRFGINAGLFFSFFLLLSSITAPNPSNFQSNPSIYFF